MHPIYSGDRCMSFVRIMILSYVLNDYIFLKTMDMDEEKQKAFSVPEGCFNQPRDLYEC